MNVVEYNRAINSHLPPLPLFFIRDLAARNVLVANESCVKLADFGMARQLAQGEDCYVGEFLAFPYLLPKNIYGVEISMCHSRQLLDKELMNLLELRGRFIYVPFLDELRFSFPD